MIRLAWITAVLAALSACAGNPLKLEGVTTELTPNAALSQIDSTRGRKVAWGGMIIHGRNQKDVTEIEVLGYPLDDTGRPDPNAAPQHRFLVVRDGYLETADYRTGRYISVVGTVEGVRQGTVGEAPYTYPVVRAQQLHLWPTDTGRTDSGPRFGVGVGIIFSR